MYIKIQFIIITLQFIIIIALFSFISLLKIYVKHNNNKKQATENQNFCYCKIRKEFLPSFILSPEIVGFAGRHWEESSFSAVSCAMCNYIKPL